MTFPLYASVVHITMALFKIYQEKSKSFRVLLKLNEEIELISIPQESKLKCYLLIKRIRKNSKRNASYVKKTSHCGSVYFKLIDSTTNSELGESMLYVNDATLESKIAIDEINDNQSKIRC